MGFVNEGVATHYDSSPFLAMAALYFSSSSSFSSGCGFDLHIFFSFNLKNYVFNGGSIRERRYPSVTGGLVAASSKFCYS